VIIPDAFLACIKHQVQLSEFRYSVVLAVTGDDNDAIGCAAPRVKSLVELQELTLTGRKENSVKIQNVLLMVAPPTGLKSVHDTRIGVQRIAATDEKYTTVYPKVSGLSR
jgi:hypothetical protein